MNSCLKYLIRVVVSVLSLFVFSTNLTWKCLLPIHVTVVVLSLLLHLSSPSTHSCTWAKLRFRSRKKIIAVVSILLTCLSYACSVEMLRVIWLNRAMVWRSCVSGLGLLLSWYCELASLEVLWVSSLLLQIPSMFHQSGWHDARCAVRLVSWMTVCCYEALVWRCSTFRVPSLRPCPSRSAK